MSVRPAIGQDLPPKEVAHLLSLDTLALSERLCQLHFLAGWTYEALGRALAPTYTARTVRSWCTGAAYNATPDPDIPYPHILTPPRKPARVKASLNPTDATRIAYLAPTARKYRATMAPNHAAAIANDQLTQLVTRCHAEGVSASDLADAAGVSYRAMAKRLGKK